MGCARARRREQPALLLLERVDGSRVPAAGPAATLADVFIITSNALIHVGRV